ncbi:MAG TPA: GatB/YqeY domain-containing protein [Syntrophales bacterium]|nr:GatB/YqeY domain-containing protein [Syntrophales bacterium]HOM07000.1 GatB/YqeY domain-containing protein [Syntrophales bacterium]HON99600.1 GatB/YqeY domain-containing protein [Syntrophales bacterium]HPC01093.1 GatB/YqeY domain-containing protein [Syntrophales bacterium]HPQ06769.1 GatB/YqeY domain-containing protein [Syntrophales bacterium]
MNFKERIEKESVAAAKEKDKIRLSALRMIKTALHNKEIELRRELTEAEFHQVLTSMVKQRKDSIEQFEKGGRPDLVEKEKAELAVVQSFLPRQLTPEELAAAIDKAIADTGAAGPKDMGKVMKALMPVISGKADGKAVSEMVKAKLSP